MASKRILKELKDIQKDPPTSCRAGRNQANNSKRVWGDKVFKTKKIFVGGIPPTVTEDELREFFLKFGEVTEHQIMKDPASGMPRGFGFIMFDNEKSFDDILSRGNKIDMTGVQVEMKKA